MGSWGHNSMTFALIEHGWHILGISRWTMLWVAHLAIKIQEALKNPQKSVIFGTQLEPTPTWPASESLGLQTTTSSGYTENFETLSASEVRGFFFQGSWWNGLFGMTAWHIFLLLVINLALIWVWVNTYRYIFSEMNIHLAAILGLTRYQGFDPSPYILDDHSPLAGDLHEPSWGGICIEWCQCKKRHPARKWVQLGTRLIDGARNGIFSKKLNVFWRSSFCIVPNYCEAALHSLFFLIVSKVVSALLRRQWGW